MPKNKLLVVCGPTATGKTDLGIYLAKIFGGEIISADSQQLYKYFDIGTGKDVAGARFYDMSSRFRHKKGHAVGYYLVKGSRIWLYDVVLPSEQFTAGEYARYAQQVIKNIWDRKRLPILLGGTGFYIKAATEGFASMGTKKNQMLREKLNLMDIESLKLKLRLVDEKKWEKMNNSDRNNPRRLVRAIELASMPKKASSQKGLAAEVLAVGLIASKESLRKMIEQRVKRREGKIISEIESLIKDGYGWESSTISNVLSYSVWQPFFMGKKNQEDTISDWLKKEVDYSRRQLTWFRRNKNINWFDVERAGWKEVIAKKVGNWYHKNQCLKK